ncbi:hypothetical protein SAMN04488074_11466 [Lentzea albidocapillata subsp. violacea]|uniref:Uncharacterized protein n=1 Tax=Lentzea albidocapillata subsp. violacea TaxID=128104 RepID=A0A1G9NMD0_9PSEU|nr:hypothetical protein [Lentzea albidocapillata]SDL87197.1 hypothetical protein SAMN04488074_11466 [Lentzea albidocapillata subsp. violacea]
MIKPDIPQLDPMRLQVRKHALLNEIRPKPSRRWWRFTVPATALVAAVAVTLVLWTPANQDASASWTAEPRAPGDLAPVLADCVKTLDDHDARGEGERPNWLAPREVSVVDQRGEMTMVLFTGPQSEMLCLRTPKGVSMAGNGNAAGREPLGDRLFADFDPQLGIQDVNTRNSMNILTGRVSPKVGKVVIGTEDGLEVTATIGNGWVVAWWPSSGKQKYVKLYDGAGGVLQTSPIPVRVR